MKIAIWGSYDHGNYGDDIMAVMFANHLKNEGFTPVVYRLDKKIATEFGIETTNDLDHLIEDSRMCIIGGGGMLIGDNLLRILARKNTFKFELDFYYLKKKLEKYNVSCMALSIGGDNSKLNKLPLFRRSFFKSKLMKFSTVRLKSDLNIMKELDIESKYHPDILLSIPYLFKIADNKKTDKKRIGVNLIEKDCPKLIDYLYTELQYDNNFEIVYIKSHLPNYPVQYENVEKLKDSKIEIFQYTNIGDILSLIGSLDLLVSSKLHLGVTALGLGVPFCSYSGKKKTMRFLAEIESEFAIHKESNLDEVKRIISNPKDFRAKFDFHRVKRNSIESKLHFSYIEKQIKEIGG